jgi:peptidoglycan/LPS O-acetylase OafA/YrhL
MVQTHSNPQAAYLSTFTRIWEIALGALLAIMPETWAFGSERINALIGWSSLAILFLSGWFIYSAGVPGPLAIWPCLGTLGIIWTGRRSGPWGPNAFLMLKPVVYIGNMSYSLYLWNYIWLYLPLRLAAPGITMAAQAVAPRLIQIGAGFLTAVGSYHFVEWPLRESSLLERKLWVNIPIGFGLIGIVVLAAWACNTFWPV